MAKGARFDFKRNIVKALNDLQLRKNLRAAMDGLRVKRQAVFDDAHELAELLRRSDLLISNDSAPIHIASAFDTYILAIFGPTTRDLGFFPYSRNSTVIEHHNLPCRPCGLHGGNRCPKKHFRCMLEITPQRVYEEAIRQLDI